MYLHVTQSFWLVLVAVVSAVAVFSLVLGAVAIRAKGVYFALITFGAAEILSKIAHNTRAIGGGDGLLCLPGPGISLLPRVALDLHNTFAIFKPPLPRAAPVHLRTRRLLHTAVGAPVPALPRN